METTSDPLVSLGSLQAQVVAGEGIIVTAGTTFSADRVKLSLDDKTQTITRVAPIGVVLAVLTFWLFLLGLLFLLIRESSTSGYIFVTLTDLDTGRTWVEPVIVATEAQRADVVARYSYLVRFTAWAGMAREAEGVNS